MLSMIRANLSSVLTHIEPIGLALFVISICSAVIFFRASIFPGWRKRNFTTDNTLSELRELRKHHETAGRLQDLIEFDGAGSWPPQACHNTAWPIALRPYHDVYLKLAKSLPTANVPLDKEIVSKRRLEYRAQMRNLLHNNVDLSAVEEILSVTEAMDRSVLSEKAYNGFYACIAISRHAFRFVQILDTSVSNLSDFSSPDGPPYLLSKSHKRKS
jgi:hypothetical protein